MLALAVAFAWDGWRLWQAKDELTAHAAAARDALTERDAAALASEVDELEQSAATFARATDGPHWWIAAHTPWVADQAVPLMAAGRAVDAIATEALAPLAGIGSLDALEAPAFEDGRIDPDTLAPYRDTLATVAAALAAQQEALAAVDLTGTLDVVATPVIELRTQLATVSGIVNGGHVAAELLPGMLGGDGARTYLVMVQNNAEPRTSGGIPGAVIELTVDDGRLTMGEYHSASSFVDQDSTVELTADEERIFTRRMAVYPQDVNFTPEFPRAATVLTDMWDSSFDRDVDGVISVDPVALGWLLEGAPPTEVDQFTITADNLAPVMLNEAYLEIEDPQEQDAFFARASAQLFGRLVSGQASTLSGVQRSIEAGRFLVWSADPGEQELLAATPVAGGFLERDDAMGLFLNDGSGSKIGYYIDNETTLTDHLCTDGSLAGQTLEVSLTHTYEGDPSALPRYISGGDVYVPESEFHTNVLLYPASGTGVIGVSIDGEGAGLNPERHDGRTLGSVRVVLAPGESTTLTFDLGAHEAALVPPTLVETPGPRPTSPTRATDYSGDC